MSHAKWINVCILSSSLVSSPSPSLLLFFSLMITLQSLLVYYQMSVTFESNVLERERERERESGRGREKERARERVTVVTNALH